MSRLLLGFDSVPFTSGLFPDSYSLISLRNYISAFSDDWNASDKKIIILLLYVIFIHDEWKLVQRRKSHRNARSTKPVYYIFKIYNSFRYQHINMCSYHQATKRPPFQIMDMKDNHDSKNNYPWCFKGRPPEWCGFFLGFMCLWFIIVSTTLSTSSLNVGDTFVLFSFLSCFFVFSFWSKNRGEYERA